MSDDDKEAVVEYIDPDWKDHFQTNFDAAYEFYWHYANDEVQGALKYLGLKLGDAT